MTTASAYMLLKECAFNNLLADVGGTQYSTAEGKLKCHTLYYVD
jgi:hypothetical protein